MLLLLLSFETALEKCHEKVERHYDTSGQLDENWWFYVTLTFDLLNKLLICFHHILIIKLRWKFDDKSSNGKTFMARTDRHTEVIAKPRLPLHGFLPDSPRHRDICAIETSSKEEMLNSCLYCASWEQVVRSDVTVQVQGDRVGWMGPELGRISVYRL